MRPNSSTAAARQRPGTRRRPLACASVPMIRKRSGIRPASSRWKRPGRSLRFARSPRRAEQHDHVVVRASAARRVAGQRLSRSVDDRRHAHPPAGARRGRRTPCASPTAAWSAKSASPRELKRSYSAVVSTFAGTPSSTAASTVHRPSPESETRPAKPSRSGDAASAAAVRSSSHEATTLPRRHSSATCGDVDVVLVVLADRAAARSRRPAAARPACRRWRGAGR